MSDLRRLRRLLPYLRRDRRRLVTALTLLVPLAAAGAVQPLLVGQVVTVLRGENAWGWLQTMPTTQAIHCLIGLMFGAVLLRLMLQGSQTFLVQSLGQRLTARLRVDLFRHALDLSSVPAARRRVCGR